MYGTVLKLMLITMLLSTPALTGAATATFDFTADFTGMINHWPGSDAMIGTDDDLIDPGTWPVEGSEPNPGTYSYNAFDFGSGQTGPGMPDGFNAITYITGTVEIDLDVAVNGSLDQPLVTGLNVTSGTEPFPGHGPFTAEFTNTTGAYDAPTGGMTLTADFTANLNGSVDTSLGMNIVGQAWVIEDEDYGTATGHAYLDDVVIPLAQAEGATRALFILGSGIIPVAEGLSWPSMPFVAAIVALDDSEVADERSTWGDVKTLYGSH